MMTNSVINSEGLLILQDRSSRESRTATDFVMYGMLLAIGALQFAFALRNEDIIYGMPNFELARSLLEKSFYGYNFTPETVYPPGFPAILALVCATAGCSHAVLLRSGIISSILGMIVSYELLRCLQTRVVAVISCLLLATSPIFFVQATRSVTSDLPYFFVSMATLWLAVRLDPTKNSGVKITLSLLCGLFLGASLLIRSAGIALLAGLIGWLVVTFFADKTNAMRRLKIFLPLLLLGILVQGLWMHWASEHEALQWPMLEGYPKSYLAQLKVKNGNYPELGTATLGDIPARVTRNLNDQAVLLAKLLTRKEYINPSWFSPLLSGPVLLILLGLGFSMWPRGGNLPEWYFISYETMCLLWPWFGDIRFFLPVAPLACLYLWRGGAILLGFARQRPRVAGAWSFPVLVFLGIDAVYWAWHSAQLQPILASIFWASIAAISAWITLTSPRKAPHAFASFSSRFRRLVSLRNKSWLTVPRALGAVTVAVLVVVGLRQELAEGRYNLSFDLTKLSSYVDIEAGKWIAANTASSAIVMGRDRSIIYHYSKHKVIWFPPSSNPQILMEGIRKQKVEFVIVTERRQNYWLPPESICFDSVYRAYPKAFELVHEESLFRVFKVVA
ncbi:MAG TPA: glycosyltransferase family 39 protein [Candidatus Binatia bacterium]|jgi:voltage-gated potassium channel Kch